MTLPDVIIVFEPTGGYEQALRTFLKMHCLNFSCVHQNKVRHYAKAKGWLAKTDKIDSKLISDYAHVFTLKVTQTYDSDNQQILHNLIKRREQLLLCKGQELARLDKFSDIAILEFLKEHVEYLDQNLKSIETRIKEICNSDTQIKNNITNLTSIPGVGIVLATNVIANLPELGNINIRKATSLIGLTPYARESSSYRGRRTIFAGREEIFAKYFTWQLLHHFDAIRNSRLITTA